VKPTRHLGDSHNFGRRVSVNGKRVLKPRTLLWEYLLLDADSPLRKLLRSAALEDGLSPESFEFLPSLKFPGPLGPSGGEVERLSLEPLGRLSAAKRRELAAIFGRALALFSWLGIVDLHWENLALGADRRGRLIFGPLDVEMLFSDLSLPTETKLLPDADPEYAELCRHAAGARRLLPYLGKPVPGAQLVAMAAAYHAALVFLERHAPRIARTLRGVPGLRDAPLRVLLRSTGEYLQPPEALWPPLLDAERQQLARGDIPYFFRLYGRRGIHYYGDAGLTVLERLPLRGDVPQLDPILQLSRNLAAPSRKTLREDGLFTLLGAFDHRGLDGSMADDDLSLRFGARSLVVQLPSGEELRAGRDLSAFVGSLYLPCSCGETRSVLVPPVTVCESARRSV
jgi:hypothetical protein